MAYLAEKRIILGITGGIAAYKSAILVRLLRSVGATVRVVMTDAAQAFITPLTLQALSGHPVRCNLLDAQAEAGIDHIELARWAEHIVIAPASADFIAKLANGFANDLLSTLCLATQSPIFLAPAMNQQMWQHPATQANISVLKARKVTILGPAEGVQACGEVGLGRMLEPEAIVAALKPQDSLLDGVKVLLTAGPTREPLDPVRYITNRSSGRMGYALAQALVNLGANVRLISGPVNIPTPAGAERILVETALEMRNAVQKYVNDCSIFIASAAVADYRVATPGTEKIKKRADTLSLHLIRNPDILAEVANTPNPPFTVGFAAETQDLETNALHKLSQKNLAMIAANLVGQGRGFEVEDNALLVFWPGSKIELSRQSKTELAQHLAVIIAQRYLDTINSNAQF